MNDKKEQHIETLEVFKLHEKLQNAMIKNINFSNESDVMYLDLQVSGHILSIALESGTITIKEN